MLEWKVTEDPAPLPTDPDVSPMRPRSWRRMGLYLLLALIVLIGATVGVVQWRTRVVATEMEADLLALIRREEQAHRFGLSDQARQFVAPDVPTAWRGRYLASFDPPLAEAVPITVTLADFTLEGEEAVVQVQMGRQVQSRRYRQTEAGWRRVPLRADMQGVAVNQSVEGVTYAYRDTDARFAAQVMQDYPALVARWQIWGGRLPTIAALDIHADEFVRPVYADGTTLNVTSPQVVAVPVYWNLTGEETSRFLLAREVGARMPIEGINPYTLPGYARFLSALTTVSALRWAVAEEPYAELTALWHEVAQQEQDSSFLRQPNHSQRIDPYVPTQEEAAALLIADTLYTQGGDAQLAAVALAMPDAASWDAIFMPITGLNTVQLETLARNGVVPDLVLNADPLVGIPRYTGISTAEQVFQMQAEGYDTPIWVQTDGATAVMLEDGTPVNSACAMAFPAMRLEGEWYESGLRFAASHILPETSLIQASQYSQPAPADTLYYLTTYERDSNNNVYTQMTAVAADGERTVVWSRPYLDFTPMWQSMMQGDGVGQGVLATGYRSQGCDVQWLFRYDADGGTEQAWYFQSPAVSGMGQYLWDASQNRGVALAPVGVGVEQGYGYWTLDPTAASDFLTVAGQLPPGEPRLLRPNSDDILLWQRGTNQLYLYDMAQQATDWTYDISPIETVNATFFDPTGRWLYVNVNVRDPYTETPYPDISSLERFDLQTEESVSLWEADNGAIGNLVLDASGEMLYAIARPSGSNSGTLMRWQDGTWTTLFTPSNDEDLYNLRGCSGGGALLLKSTKPAGSVGTILPPTLYFITPDGTFDPTPIPLSVDEFPLMC